MEMSYRRFAVLLTACVAASSISLVAAQTGPGASSNDQYVPRLGDIMDTAQMRHTKLWYAGKAANWALAAFELGQLKGGLVEAAQLYSGIPASNVTTLAAPLQALAGAIEAKDGRRFAKAYGELTDGCNSCHAAMGRSFIVMRQPADQPFGDQVFSPQGKR
jgi:hypothetical protein